MKRFDLELAVGFFLVIGILAMGYISIKLGKLEVIGQEGYTVYATFAKAGGVKAGCRSRDRGGRGRQGKEHPAR
jgi:phospholipid/cholesterol/gamma-HCH transport system substrate-binding protein